MLKTLQGLAEGQAKWPLFLYGPAGRGKTCAALALCDVVPSAVYQTTEEAADAIVREEAGYWLWHTLADHDLAVLDELGARERIGDLHYQAVKRFADLRDRQPAIYISNLTPAEIREVYDDRIASRVLCGTWHEARGADRRFA